ncbi:GNAT family N-acetyltransferase [Adlercreutzia sp. ZJ138]|uniref:GNAT family N-acetyltransferase n=1 Tax=Adlercreutzia sp. ZJ138 TaxID=2709405 RepID=UPI0013EC6637|nr:GNAT family N-acetyltransferase [Adlercreutzia sp. ZJ138]
MRLPGIVTVNPADRSLIKRLATMMGDSFMEEQWTCEVLSVLPDNSDRKREVSRTIILASMTGVAPADGCYTLNDSSALALAYLKSELGDTTWSQLEKRGAHVLEAALSAEELTAIEKQEQRMEAVSVFNWEYEAAHEMGFDDFIHFVCLAVDTQARGSGSFRHLITPFFDYADAHNIPCFLETYSDKLEALYRHVGFQTIRTFCDPAFDIVERGMVRMPG